MDGGILVSSVGGLNLISRVGQNHMYTVSMRHIRQGNYQVRSYTVYMYGSG